MFKSYYSILGAKVSLETSLKEINDYCDYMLQEFLSERVLTDASLIQVKHNPEKRNHFSIYKNGSIAIDWGHELISVPYDVLSKALENVVSGHAINQVDKKDVITLHSGVISKNNKGILILGESGDGKSTFTLEMIANHDWLYLTDEVGLLDKNYNLLPFLKTVSYQPGIVKLNGDWISKQFGVEHQVAVPKEKQGKAIPLRAVFFVKYSPDAKPQIKLIKKSDSLTRLLNAQIGRAKSVATIEQMSSVVKRVNSYQIFHNNAGDAARQVTDLMEKQ